MEGEEERSEINGSFSKATIPKRIAIVAAGAVVNIIFGLAVYFILMSTSNTYVTNEINTVINGYAAQEIGLEQNDKIIEIDGKKIKNKYDLNKAMEKNNGNNINLKIERQGEILEYNVKPTEIKTKSTGIYLDENCKILTVEKGSSAEKSGLQANDKIIEVNNQKIEGNYSKIAEIIQEKDTDEILITVKMVENSTMKVTLGEVATTDDYMIIEYEVDVKDKNIEIENGYLDDVSFEIDRDIKIDGKEVNYTDEKGQFAYKESDNKVKVYDLINIKNKKLSDTYKLEVIVYDIYGNGDEIDADLALEDTNDESADEEIYDEEDTEEYVDETEADGLEEDSSEGGYEEVTIDSDEYYQAIENMDEETLIEEATSEEDSADDTTDEISSEDDISSESDKIGTITVKLNKADTNKNASIIKKNEKSTQDNVTVNVNTIIKTNSAKFITVETDVTGVTKEQIENDDLTNPENIQVAVLDKDGNTLNVGKVEESYLYDSEGNKTKSIRRTYSNNNG